MKISFLQIDLTYDPPGLVHGVSEYEAFEVTCREQCDNRRNAVGFPSDHERDELLDNFFTRIKISNSGDARDVQLGPLVFHVVIV